MAAKKSSKKSSVTRDDVARLAGVSAAVVSYVVNDSKPVAPATAKRVTDAIAKLGYRPNRTARALRLGSSETLGILVPDMTNPFFMALTHEVEIAAAKRGYALLTMNAEVGAGADIDPDVPKQIIGERRQLENLMSRSIDGAIICSVLSVPDLGMLDGALPFVLMNQLDPVAGVSSIGVDLRRGAEIAVEHLAEHGHERIGMIAGTTAQGKKEPREAGWRHAVQRLGLEQGPVVWDSFDPEGGYRAAKELLDEGDVPSALFVASDQMAKGVLRAFHERDVQVPDDVAVVSFDGSLDAEFYWPPLTTVAQPLVEMAERAIDMLLGSRTDPHGEVLMPVLARRDTCGCIDGEWPED